MLAFTKNVALFLSLASAVAVSAVETDTERNLRAVSAVETDTERNLLWGSWGSYDCKEYKAELVQEPGIGSNDQGLEGTVWLKQCGSGDKDTDGSWKVNIKDFDTTTCISGTATGELNWHIHAAETGPGLGCQSGQTKGHYDPTYACGPATQWDSTLCTTINQSRGGNGYTYSTECTSDTQEGCEIGDLSGKMGKVQTNLSSWKIQKFEDNWLGGIEKIDGLSIVFHCCIQDGTCKRRVGCANLVEVV